MQRYTGAWDKQLDTTSSLVLMGARPYDPSLGRFLAVDPIDGGSLNNYDYAGQDPINSYDLGGLMKEGGEIIEGDEDAQPIDVGALTGPEETGNADGNEYVTCGGPCRGETKFTKWGKLNHIGLEAELGSGWDYNVYIPGYGYADAVNWETNEIVELKPNNASAIRNGNAQLARYVRGLENATGERWTGHLMTYQPYNGVH